MKKVILFIFTILLFVQCDDGDFAEPSFVFENNIDYCGNLIIHNIGFDDSEALIINLDVNNEDNVFFKTVWDNKEYDLTNNIFYRVFDGTVDNSYFCQNIPPATPNIVNEWIGDGKVIVNNTIVEDDKDGVEELDLDLDSDGDNIPNYLDIDDDNDGVLTADELKDANTPVDENGNVLDTDGDNLPNYLDTDGDNLPNYLDSDDDNDGVPTIEEYTTDSNGDDIVDYLDAQTHDIQTARILLPNTHNLQYTMTFTIKNLSLVNSSGNAINYANFEYGVKVGNFTIED